MFSKEEGIEGDFNDFHCIGFYFKSSMRISIGLVRRKVLYFERNTQRKYTVVLINI